MPVRSPFDTGRHDSVQQLDLGPLAHQKRLPQLALSREHVRENPHCEVHGIAFTSLTGSLLSTGGKLVEILYTHSAGLDVHKQTVVACRITPQADGWCEETCTFGTMTHDLLALADWLRAAGVTHGAMESTGIYWRPVFNLLEGEFEVLLANAKHIKYVPGRKTQVTDVKDAQWIAQLLQHGLLKASFIPPAPQRVLRELVRYRTKLIQDRTQEVNRAQKVLEDANLKLASVASDGRLGACHAE